MCGRYSFAPSAKQLEAQMLDAQRPLALQISFNIAPTQEAYVVTYDAAAIWQRMAWGLVPRWSPDGKNKGQLINARAESIAEKPSFREPIRSRRCLVPADSFYEWSQVPGGRKVPHRILLANGELMWMAGIWDEWEQGGGAAKRTFSIITTTPNREMAELHHRMPVILAEPAAQHQWLAEGELSELLPLLRPLPDGALRSYRVSEQLNKPGYDQPDVQDEVPGEWRLF